MNDGRRKLPDDNRLRRDAASGLGLTQIAARYATSKDHLRRRLKMLGIVVPDSATPSAEPSSKIRKTVIERRMFAADNGGTVIRRISLPCISMHVAVLEGRP